MENKELMLHSEYIDKNLDLIANQNKLTKDDLKNFALQCKRTGLDPITRQIYAIPGNGKLTIMASIDGLRLIAERSGAYEGQTAPMWCGDDAVWKDVWLSKQPPKACKIGVYKSKFREPLVAIALFDEYAGKYQYDDNYGKYKKGDLTHMWAKMPALMIAKVAEALALRKAFPNEMSGIYSSEEMEQSEVEKNVTPKSNVQEKPQPKPLDKQDPFEYVINLGDKNKLTGTKIKEHDINILVTERDRLMDYYKNANKSPHNNVLLFSEALNEALKLTAEKIKI